MRQQNPRVDFFSGKKRLWRIQNGVFPFTVVEFCLQLPFIRLEEAVSWTQHFLTRKIWPKNEVYLWQRNLKANVFRNSTFQVNTRKNATSRRRLTSGNWIAISSLSALHAKNDTTNLFGYELGESTENSKALPFFSSKETIQTFSGPI